jgi:hypothetical protein
MATTTHDPAKPAPPVATTTHDPAKPAPPVATTTRDPAKPAPPVATTTRDPAKPAPPAATTTHDPADAQLLQGNAQLLQGNAQLLQGNAQLLQGNAQLLQGNALLQGKMSYTDFFKSRTELVKAYSETAKSYIQISSAALALPILFTQAWLGERAVKAGFYAMGVPWSLGAAWLSFLLAIAFGLAYQWLIVRRQWEILHRDHLTEKEAPDWGVGSSVFVPQSKRLGPVYTVEWSFFSIWVRAFSSYSPGPYWRVNECTRGPGVT